MAHWPWTFTAQRLRFSRCDDFATAWLEIESRERAWWIHRARKHARMPWRYVSHTYADPVERVIVSIPGRCYRIASDKPAIIQRFKRPPNITPELWQAIQQARRDLDQARPSPPRERVSRLRFDDGTRGSAGRAMHPCSPEEMISGQEVSDHVQYRHGEAEGGLENAPTGSGRVLDLAGAGGLGGVRACVGPGGSAGEVGAPGGVGSGDGGEADAGGSAASHLPEAGLREGRAPGEDDAGGASIDISQGREAAVPAWGIAAVLDMSDGRAEGQSTGLADPSSADWRMPPVPGTGGGVAHPVCTAPGTVGGDSAGIPGAGGGPPIKRGRHGVPIYRLPGLTDEQLKTPWLIPREPGQRIDRKGQLWEKPYLWLGDWGHVLVRPSWLEPVRVGEEAERAAGRPVPVYGILGATGTVFARLGRLPRREFPPGKGRYDGVVGWRAQLLACYVLVRWAELVWWNRWKRVGYGRGKVARRALWKRRPRLNPLIRRELYAVRDGRRSWTIGTERRVAGAIEGARESFKALTAELRGIPPPRAPIKGRLNMTGGSVVIRLGP